MKDRFHRRAYALCLSIFVVMLTLVSFGAGCATPAADYVAADEANRNELAPKYLNYVENDPTLSEEEKQAERDSVEIWKQRNEANRSP